jgi:hypothetical protein
VGNIGKEAQEIEVLPAEQPVPAERDLGPAEPAPPEPAPVPAERDLGPAEPAPPEPAPVPAAEPTPARA